MGLKFLRDGKDSANLVAMYKLEGQDNDGNFFSHDFNTNVPSPTSTALKVAAAKFATATMYVTEMGLKDWGETGQDGQKNDQHLYPYNLRFKPTQ